MRRFRFKAFMGSVSLMAILLHLPRLAQAADSIPIPVRKVVLYKNGMGYFEHLGGIKGNQIVEILLPSSQLNDVLKSLTVLDLGRGQVTGVTYDSAAPLDKRLAELPIRLDSTDGLVGFLNEIRGTGVELRSPGGPFTGKLMSAELRTRSTGPGVTTQFVEVAIFTASGEIRIVELESVGSLRLTQPALANDLGRYLDLLDTSHQRDLRKLSIQTAGSSDRQLYVSYTSETPIWKTTYRIILDPKQKPLLQGWAVVDNTTPMDWLEVSLSLVAGAPVSFIQNLSQPVYGRRPVVPLPQGVQVTPQLHESAIAISGSVAAIAGSVLDSSGAAISGASVTVRDESGKDVRRVVSGEDGRFRIEVSPGTYSVRAESPSFQMLEYGAISAQPGRQVALDFNLRVGSIDESVSPASELKELDRMEKPRRDRFMIEMSPPARPGGVVGGVLEGVAGGMGVNLGNAMRQQGSSAAAQAIGEQFEYKLKQPVTIHRNESALLPIIHSEVEGDKVSLFSESAGDRRPRLAVWLKNSSGLTLDAGSFTVIDTNSFAGEGLTESIQPGESRLLSYALDLGVEVTTNIGSERQRIERVDINRGVLRMHHKVVDKKTYLIRNNDERARTLVIEHSIRPGWKLIDTPQPAESSANQHRFKIEAKAKTTTEFSVREENPQETTYMLSSVTSEQVGLWVRERSIDPEIQKALQSLVSKKNEIADLVQKIAALDREQSEIFRDQERVRGNLQRLGQTPDEATLRLRYIKQLDQQENRIGALRAEKDKLETARQSAQKQLDDMLQKLIIDRKL